MDDAGNAPAKSSLPPRGAPVRFGDFALDLDGCSLSNADGGDIALSRSEFALLREFIRHPGRVLSRDYLLDALGGKRPDPFDRSIDMLVGRLRKKIEPDPKQPRLIVTVPGEGYRFDGLTRSLSPGQRPSIAAQASQDDDGRPDMDPESDPPSAVSERGTVERRRLCRRGEARHAGAWGAGRRPHWVERNEAMSQRSHPKLDGSRKRSSPRPKSVRRYCRWPSGSPRCWS